MIREEIIKNCQIITSTRFRKEFLDGYLGFNLKWYQKLYIRFLILFKNTIPKVLYVTDSDEIVVVKNGIVIETINPPNKIRGKRATMPIIEDINNDIEE